MICPNCSFENSDAAKFCRQCGNQLIQAEKIKSEIQKNETEDHVKAERKLASFTLKTIIIVIIVLAVAVSGFFVYKHSTRLPEFTNENGELILVDIDGNQYQTVQIGDQIWMAENLKVTRYRNGDPIQHSTDVDEWKKTRAGAYCAYEYDERNKGIFGYLYNWFSVNDKRQIAPKGWHVPSDDDWKELEAFLGMSEADLNKENDDNDRNRGKNEGCKLKEAGTGYWEIKNSNANATNEYGFSARPGGCLLIGENKFWLIHYLCFFWSTAEEDSSSFIRVLFGTDCAIQRYSQDVGDGFSVRLVRNKVN